MIPQKTLAQMLIFAIFISLSVEATAQRAANIKGVGNVGCGEYLQDRRNNQYGQVYAQWVQGFVSGYNFYGQHAQTSSIPDEPTVHAYLEKYCRDNPLENVARATMFLIADLNGYRPAR